MLHDFVHLKEGDWVVQNGANSAVRVSGVFVSLRVLMVQSGWASSYPDSCFQGI
jgi:trans-2-enoyl-CoA reductase